ncbi:MAG: hypothetical protein AAF431_00485 [Pseudomonadota bacterium]
MIDSVSKLSLTLGVLLLASGCAKNFTVVGDIPQPLIESDATIAHVKFSEEFKSYAYEEESTDRALESVGFGEAQVSLFKRIFSSLFTLSEEDSDAVDLKIEPQILDFQYSAPKETKLNLYEIWLKYRLRITDHHDRELADWVVKGYGKTPTRMLSSQITAFNTASNVALRDVGAQLAIGFRNQPSIKEYLAKSQDERRERSAAELASGPEGPEGTEEPADSEAADALSESEMSEDISLAPELADMDSTEEIEAPLAEEAEASPDAGENVEPAAQPLESDPAEQVPTELELADANNFELVFTDENPQEKQP